MRLRQKIFLGSTLIIFSFILVSGIGFFFTHNVAKLSLTLVETQALPLAKLNNLKRSLYDTWIGVITHTSVSEVETMRSLEQKIARATDEVEQQLHELKKIYSYSAEEEHLQFLQEFESSWHQFQQVEQKVLKSSQDFTKGDALALILQEGEIFHQKVIASIEHLDQHHQENMEVSYQEAVIAQKNAAIITVSLTLLIAFVLSKSISHLTHQLINSLSAINEQLKLLAQGEIAQKLIDYQNIDEISEIVDSIQQLKNNTQITIQQAEAIALGDYSNEVQLLSQQDQLGQALANMTATLRQVVTQVNAVAEGDYHQEIKVLSQQDQLGQALAKMTQTLRESTARNAEQNWLKTGQAQLHEKLSGEQDILILAKSIIDFLTRYVEAQIGLFYLVRTTSYIPCLEVIASYGYTQADQPLTTFAIGEGLIGQVALERQPISRSHPPEEYTHIAQSGLSEVIPRHVFILPFLYEGVTKGVVELGAFNDFTTLQKEFLMQVMPRVGIAVNSALARAKMQEILRKETNDST
jgi:hypothetical protein